MRGAARLLQNIRKLSNSEENMSSYLKPECFDTIVKATILTASPEMDDEEELKAPSTAIKLGYDIKRLAGTKWGNGLRRNDQIAVAETKNFLKLMKLEWSIRVTKSALTTLQVRKFNSEKSLPVPDDLQALNEHVKKELQNLYLSDNSYPTFRRVEELSQTRVLLFNKRRSGEVEVAR